MSSQILIRNRATELDSRLNDGTTPLVLAARLAVEGMVEELIHCHADINAVDDHGEHTLHVFAPRGGRLICCTVWITAHHAHSYLGSLLTLQCKYEDSCSWVSRTSSRAHGSKSTAMLASALLKSVEELKSSGTIVKEENSS